ncbi:hypothetical protein BaRGS_00036594, partial [Batillaria attramentaria]
MGRPPWLEWHADDAVCVADISSRKTFNHKQHTDTANVVERFRSGCVNSSPRLVEQVV